MSTLRQHLKKFHETAADHHDELAKCFHKLSSLGKGAKSHMSDDAIAADELTQCLGKIAGAHQLRSAYHKEAMAECEKIAADDLNKSSSDLIKRLEHLEGQIVPTRVSAIAPNAPGIRAVPRAGAPNAPARPEVPLQFAKLVEIEE